MIFLALVIGFSMGVIFYAWWIRPDLTHQQKRIAELDAQREGLSRELLKAKNFTVITSQEKNKDV